jgi:predicted nuclease with TOPRIM domain
MEEPIMLENAQQTIDQVREATALLELIPRLLEENEKLRAEAESAIREVEKLRAEVEPLRSEIQRCRADREELGEAFGRLMSEMNNIAGEIAPRLKLPGRSPFARDPNAQGNGTSGNGALHPALVGSNGTNGTTSQH